MQIMWESLPQCTSAPCHQSPESGLVGLQGGSEICIFNRHLGVILRQGVFGPPLEKHCFRKRSPIPRFLKKRTDPQSHIIIHDSQGWIMEVALSSWEVKLNSFRYNSSMKSQQNLCHSHIHQGQSLTLSLGLLILSSFFPIPPLNNGPRKDARMPARRTSGMASSRTAKQSCEGVVRMPLIFQTSLHRACFHAAGLLSLKPITIYSLGFQSILLRCKLGRLTKSKRACVFFFFSTQVKLSNTKVLQVKKYIQVFLTLLAWRGCQPRPRPPEPVPTWPRAVICQ